MKRDQLEIQEPCSEDWGDMTGGESSRHCDKCVKSVHNVSSMTREAASNFLADNQDSGVCVVYQLGRDEEVRFADGEIHERSVPMGQLLGAKRLVAAALLAVPLLTACDTAPPECDSSSADTFTPLELIMEQERTLMNALGDIWEEEQPVLMGEPTIEPMLGAVEPMIEPPVLEPLVEPIQPVMGGLRAIDPPQVDIIEVPEVETVRPEHEIQDQLDTQLNEFQPRIRHMMGKMAPTQVDRMESERPTKDDPAEPDFIITP